MALDPVKNFAISRVATAPSPAASGTTLVVEAGDGALFPDPSSSGEYNVVIYPNGEQPTSTNAEIVRVTARTSDTMTITREQESTSARTVAEGDIVMLGITAKVVSDLSTAVTGVVTETGTQTLTNKTLTSPKINENVALTANSTELNLLDNQTVLRKQIIGDYSPTGLTAGNTLYFACGQGGSNAYEPSYVMSIAGTVRNLVVYSSGSPGVGQTYTATMMANNSAQSLTCTIVAGTNVATDTTHFFTVSVGDRISLRVVASAGAVSTSINFAFEFDPS